MKSLLLIALIVVFGSCSDSEIESPPEEPAQFPVVDLGDFPAPIRYGAIGFSAKGKGYIVGGLDRWGYSNSTRWLNELWEYTPGTNTWVRKGDTPTSVNNIPAKVVDDIAYFLNWKMELWTYDATKDIWTNKSKFPGTERSGLVSMEVDGKLYVGLGWAWEPLGPLLYNDWWEYDPSSNLWNQKSNAPFDGGSGVTWSISNHGYMAFGYIPDNVVYNEFWEYDPAKDSWIERKALYALPFSGQWQAGLTIAGKPAIILEKEPGLLKVYQYGFEKEIWNEEYKWANRLTGGMATFSISTSHYFVFGHLAETSSENSSDNSTNKVWVFNE